MPVPDRDVPRRAGRSPMLPRNVTTSRPELEQRLLTAPAAVADPLPIGPAIRDRDGRILDSRLEYVSPAAARWAGVAREALIGLITGELLPDFRASGYFDSLRDVVETGIPFHRDSAPVADAVAGGSWIGGTYDLRAICLGDRYLSTWRPTAGVRARRR